MTEIQKGYFNYNESKKQSDLYFDVISPNVVSPLTISFASGDTGAKTVDIPVAKTKRTIQEIKVNIPDSINAITWTFAIIDPEGVGRYSISGLAKNTNIIILVQRAIHNSYKFRMIPSGSPGSSVIISIYPDYLEE